MKIRKIKRNRIDVTTYFMPPETKKVAVEYLLYDLIGVIGAVGGTMGLFIGFSMFGKYILCVVKKHFVKSIYYMIQRELFLGMVSSGLEYVGILLKRINGSRITNVEPINGKEMYP